MDHGADLTLAAWGVPLVESLAVVSSPDLQRSVEPSDGADSLPARAVTIRDGLATDMAGDRG